MNQMEDDISLLFLALSACNKINIAARNYFSAGKINTASDECQRNYKSFTRE